MQLLRSPRFPAIVLLAAAAAALVVANSPLGDAARAVKEAYLGPLSTGHWIQDGLLAVFFFVVAVELQYELTSGELRSARRALQPAIAAAGGVIVPIGLYLVVAGGSDAAAGWPVPTATDIAFALGVLAVFGRGLPAGIRIFLLALAILDDVVGIVLIAVLYTSDLRWGYLVAALAVVVVFGVLSRRLDTRAARPLAAVLVVLAVLTWVLVLLAGVHPTIAGVALGLAMAQHPAMRTRHALEPWVNAIVLPLFAFSAALVAIPAVSPAELSPAFWGVIIALPVGKIVGIAAAGWLAQRLFARGATPSLSLGDLLAAGALGGIGFTVSLLLAGLAFDGAPELADQATLGVLVGSLVSLVLASALVALRARRHGRRGPDAVLPEEPEPGRGSIA